MIEAVFAYREIFKMKNLSVFLKDYKKESILAPAFKLLEAVFDLLVPLAVARMIDATDRGTVFLYFGALLLMAAVGLSCTVVAQYYSARASVGFAGKLRMALFGKIQSLSLSDVDTIGGDTLITRLSGDVNQVQNGLNLALRLLLRSPMIVIGCTVMAFLIDVKSAAVFAVTVPILFAVTFIIMKLSIPLFGRAQSALDKVTLHTRESITGARVIRAFCREETTVSEFDAENERLTKLNLFVGRLSALLNPLTYVLINLAAALLIRRAGESAGEGLIGRGEVVALYNYMLQIIVELIKLTSLIITLNRSLACAKRVSDVLSASPDMSYPDSGAEMADSGVRFDNVSFAYRFAGANSLSGVSFYARPGEKVGIIGGTGSGKTTLVDLIPRFYDASAGRVEVGGRDVREYPRGELIKNIGIVPQRAALFRGTVRENLMLGSENATEEELWQALDAAQARGVVESKKDGLDSFVEQGGGNFSGGQRQRLTIARALVKKPRILIMDDSSSALDYATDAALRKEVCALEGVTVFIVSQRIAGVRDCDRILVLDNGSLVGNGTHGELLKECGVYRDIYRSQFPDDEGEKEAEA